MDGSIFKRCYLKNFNDIQLFRVKELGASVILWISKPLTNESDDIK